ncbi:MAG: AAA family ATPase [Candidatus Eiseniibacteriota bacterium]
MKLAPKFKEKAEHAEEASSAEPSGDGFKDIMIGQGSAIEAAAFVTDQATAETVASVMRGQSMAAVVRAGNVVSAAKQLGAMPAPRLLMVDLSSSDMPMRDIDGLAEVCEPGTTVIALGDKNDVALFRDLIAAGVADYLVKPLSEAALIQAVGKANERPADPQTGEKALGRFVVVIGARGGVGASTIAANCGYVMAKDFKKRVAVVDLDLQFGTASLTLDVEPGRGLREALENPSRIDSLFIASAAVNAGENLYILGAEEPLDDLASFAPEALDLLLTELRRSFDCVVVDIPRAAAVHHRDALAGANAMVVVTDLSLAGMRDTLRLSSFAKRVASEGKLFVVANRVGADKKGAVPKADFEKGIEGKVDFIVPEDMKSMALANHTGKPVPAVAAAAKVSQAFRDLGRQLAGTVQEEKKKSFWSKVVKKK